MTDTHPAITPFTSGELLLHHRYAQGVPITCGVPHGCITAVVEDVQCSACREILVAFPEDPLECDHGRWNPDNGQCLDCGSPESAPKRETLEERLANRRQPGDPGYDAFYDATDAELAAMVPPARERLRGMLAEELAVLRADGQPTEGATS